MEERTVLTLLALLQRLDYRLGIIAHTQQIHLAQLHARERPYRRAKQPPVRGEEEEAQEVPVRVEGSVD